MANNCLQYRIMAEETIVPPEAEPTPEPDRAFISMAWIIAVAAGALIFGITLRTAPVLCPNDGSRWDTIWSLVEKGTYIIDDCPWPTIDMVHRDGHDYSSKPALWPTLMAGEYWLIKKLTKWTIQDNTEPVCRTILFTWNVIPLVIYIGLVGHLLARCCASQWWRGYWLVAAALGTYVTGYCVTLNDHSLGAMSALFAFYCGIQILHFGNRKWIHFSLAGLFAAWTVCNQLPSAFFGIALFVWLLVREPKRTLMFGLPAALLVVGGFMATTYASTGGFVPYYMYKNTELYQYEGSYWTNPVGIDALAEPKHIYLFNSLIGHHGFFSLSPIFVFSVIGIGFALFRSNPQARQIAWFVLFGVGASLVINVWKTNNYGGVCQGFRYLIWPVPLIIIAGSFAARQYGRAKWVRAIALCCLFISVMTMGVCTDNPWSRSWLEDLCMKHDWLWATY